MLVRIKKIARKHIEAFYVVERSNRGKGYVIQDKSNFYYCKPLSDLLVMGEDVQYTFDGIDEVKGSTKSGLTFTTRQCVIVSMKNP